MLESTGMVPAGVIIIDDEPAVIYCDVDTGACAFELPSIGMPQEITGVTMNTPCEVQDLDSLVAALNKTSNRIGIILSTECDHVVIIDEDNAYIGKYSDEPKNVFSIDVSSDYDVDEDYEDGEVFI